MSQPSTAGVSLFSGLRRTLEPQPLAPVLPAAAARATYAPSAFRPSSLAMLTAMRRVSERFSRFVASPTSH